MDELALYGLLFIVAVLIVICALPSAKKKTEQKKKAAVESKTSALIAVAINEEVEREALARSIYQALSAAAARNIVFNLQPDGTRYSGCKGLLARHIPQIQSHIITVEAVDQAVPLQVRAFLRVCVNGNISAIRQAPFCGAAVEIDGAEYSLEQKQEAISQLEELVQNWQMPKSMMSLALVKSGGQ